MQMITVRLSEELMNIVNTMAANLHISRGECVRQSIEHMNKLLYEKQRAERLINASHKVRKESMLVNSEFSEIEYDPEA